LKNVCLKTPLSDILAFSKDPGSNMIQNRHQLETFYRRLEAQENLSCTEAMAIYDMLHKEAVSLGAIHSNNMLDGSK
jgi:hypothetical protein